MQRGEDEDEEEEEEEFEILNYYKIWLLCRHNFSLLSFSSTHFASDFFVGRAENMVLRFLGTKSATNLSCDMKPFMK